MSPLGMFRAIMATLALILILLAVSAWTGFPFSGPRNWIQNLSAEKAVAEEATQSALSTQEELEKVMNVGTGQAQKRMAAKERLYESSEPKPTDSPTGEDAARRRYDAWYDGVARVCPQCETEKLGN